MNVFYQKWTEWLDPTDTILKQFVTLEILVTSIDIPKCYPLPPSNIDT